MLNNFYAGGVNNGGWGRYGKERKIFIKSPNGLFMIWQIFVPVVYFAVYGMDKE